MNDQTKSLIKIVGIAAGAYLLYQWLQSSGLWAQWFGGSDTFTNAQQLLAYCHANPNGSATFVNPQTGQSQTATCAAWIQANSESTSSAASSTSAATTTMASAPSTPAASVAPAAGSSFIARLQSAALGNSMLGSDSANVSQWNFLVDQMWPTAPQISVSTPAGNNAINASTYVGYYLAQGFPDPTISTSGGAGVSGFEAYQSDPYSWGKPN